MNDFSLSFPQTLLYFNLMNIIYPTSLEPFLLRTPNLNIIRMTHSFSWSRDRDPFRNCLYFFNVAHVKRLQNELRSSEYRCDASTEQLFTWASVFRLVSMNGNIHQKEGCSIWEKGLRCISLGARSSVFYVSAFPMNLELCFVREHEFTDARDAREQSRTLAALSRDSSRISIDLYGSRDFSIHFRERTFTLKLKLKFSLNFHRWPAFFDQFGRLKCKTGRNFEIWVQVQGLWARMEKLVEDIVEGRMRNPLEARIEKHQNPKFSKEVMCIMIHFI